MSSKTKVPKYNMEQKKELAQNLGMTAENVIKILTINNQLFKGLKSMTDLSWIGDNEKNIVDWIKTAKTNKKQPYTEHTKRTFYNVLAVYYRSIGNKDKQDKYANIGKDINENELKKQTERQDKGELKSNEKYVPFKTIENIRDQYIIKWNAEQHNNQLNIKTLLLCLQTLQPPMRSEILNMPIYQTIQPDIKTENYIFKTGNLWNYRINKKTKHQKENNYTLKLSKKLSDIISLSIKKFPRKWLIAKWNDVTGQTKISKSAIDKWLNSMNLGFNAMRKSYITNYFNVIHNPSQAELERLALQMRHSTEVQQKYYNKRVPAVVEEEKQESVNIEPVVARKKPGPMPKYPQGNFPAKSIEKQRDLNCKYSKTYYDTNPLKAKAKSYLYKLNNKEHKNHIQNPSARIIELYKLDLLQDGKWVSKL